MIGRLGWRRGECRLNNLVKIGRWIKSDAVIGTADQLLEEVMNDLWLQRSGTRIVVVINQATAKSHGA